MGIFRRFAQSHTSFANWSSALSSLQPSLLPTAPGVPQQSFFGLTNLSSVVMIVKEENDRLAKEVSATAAALWLLALHTETRTQLGAEYRRQAGQGSQLPAISGKRNANLTRSLGVSAMAILDQLTLWPCTVALGRYRTLAVRFQVFEGLSISLTSNLRVQASCSSCSGAGERSCEWLSA
jgi:hypothetical protein